MNVILSKLIIRSSSSFSTFADNLEDLELIRVKNLDPYNM